MSLNGQEPKPERDDLMRVRNDSNPKLIGASIYEAFQESSKVTIRVIGAGALNQAYKGAALARQRLAANAEDLVIRPGFATVKSDDGNHDVTALVLACTLL
jgi:stage V sporulation protein SpoVS